MIVPDQVPEELKEERYARLMDLTARISADKLASINAPVGLDIGAMGAPEIAVSIIAQVTAALRGKLKPPGSKSTFLKFLLSHSIICLLLLVL